MLWQAIRACAEWERKQVRCQQVFGAVAPTRKVRKQVDQLARHLLVWHIEQGHTLDTIRTMIGAPNLKGGE